MTQDRRNGKYTRIGEQKIAQDQKIKNNSGSEKRTIFQDWSKENIPEKKEISPDDKIIADELRREIETMEVEDTMKAEAKKKAESVADFWIKKYLNTGHETN